MCFILLANFIFFRFIIDMQICYNNSFNMSPSFQRKYDLNKVIELEAEVVKLHGQNLLCPEISKILGVSDIFVRNVMKKYSLKSAYKQKQEIILNYIENISPKRIREILNCSQSHANFLYSTSNT